MIAGVELGEAVLSCPGCGQTFERAGGQEDQSWPGKVTPRDNDSDGKRGEDATAD